MPRYRLTALAKSATVLTESGEVHEMVCGDAEAALLHFGRKLGQTLSWASDASPDYVLEIVKPDAGSIATSNKIPVYVVRSKAER